MLLCLGIITHLALVMLPFFSLSTAFCYALLLSLLLPTGLYVLLSKSKTQLHITRRLLRLCALQYVTLGVGCYFAQLLNSSIILPLLCLFLPLLLPLSNIILTPLELAINYYYLNKASHKLINSACTVIGITGSYGKTSVKNILSTLLGDCIATPHSYNTPLGIAKFINQTDINTTYVIVEMGAKHRWDIDKLCRLYKPTYGIITGIAPCHIQTFGNMTNLINTKQELLLNLPDSGLCVMPDNLRTTTFAQVGKCKRLFVPLSQSSSACKNCPTIDNIKCSSMGSSFTLHYNGKQVECNTILVGEHNIHNIELACAMALYLGVELDSIAQSIATLQPIPHRLCLIKQNGFTILDDSYNANIDGVRALCSVLGMFTCKRLIITQGIVEQGKHQQEQNVLVGQLLSSCADIVCVVGSNSTYITQGLLNKHFDINNIYVANSLEHAVQLLSNQLMGNLLVFQNDLPDNL
ncbi:MAG: UDP-N-acetylmuramoyl-tripeptide--D-alanyl-D-alanine ligase [Clostridia bacterium]|nr:UDP-N-acetylmuramoyl-tripeptide--D-alanyl-D-alanine ligase [Clostridia bacterium]